MRTAAEYRSEAEGYILRAQEVVAPGQRLKLLEMAQSCLRLADQAELLAESAAQPTEHRIESRHITHP